MRSKLIAVTLIFLVAFGLSYYLWTPEGDGLGSAAADTDSRTADVEPESAESLLEPAMSEDVNPTDAELSEPNASIVLGRHEWSPPPGSLLPPDVLVEVRYSAFIASLFESEPIDGDWAFPLETRMYEIWASQTIRAITLAAHCRTAMCRIEVAVDTSDPNAMSYADFMTALEPLWISDPRLTTFIDSHRGNSPSTSYSSANVQVWQGYLVGSEVEQAVNDEVANWARERPSIQQRLESRR